MNAVTPNTSSATVREEGAQARQEPALLPPVDVVEDPTGITLYADLPGVPRDKLNLRVESEQLTIEADLVLALPPGMVPSHAEVQHARYRRAYLRAPLPGSNHPIPES